jgi:hypothetical protein
MTEQRMTEQRMKDKNNVFESINDFYKMKDKYETGFKEKYINPLLKAKNSSKREKRMAFSKLPKPECINCKRPVGTVFSISHDPGEFNRKYIAKCGDSNDPCPLNINIIYGTRLTYENETNKYETEIDILKKNIIKEKYNMIFGYIDEQKAIEKFDEFTSELKDSTLLAGNIIEKNILVNDNPEKTELLKRAIDIFGKEYVLQFKNMMKQYDDTGNELLVNEAVAFYKNEMMPRIKEIQDLKYEINSVEYDYEQAMFVLYQRKNSLQNLEYSYSSEDKVVAFVKGTKESSIKSKSKTLKMGKKGTSSKSKTRKAVILVEEDIEEEEQEQKEEQEEQKEEEQEEEEYAPNSPAYAPNSPEF